MAQLYTYLMGQVHRAINRAFAQADLGVAEAGAGADKSSAESPLSRTLGTLLEGMEAAGGGAGAGAGAGAVAEEEAATDRLRRMADEAEFLGGASSPQHRLLPPFMGLGFGCMPHLV